MKTKLSSLCHCNSNKPYAVCCSPYHKGKIHAPTAEALMRSRYSAYVTKNVQYVYRSWDEKTRPPLKVLREDNSQEFTKLEIINTTAGGSEDETGTVEFIASYMLKDSSDISMESEIHQHHENSYFVKLKNRWVYVNELNKIDFENDK